MPRTTQQRETHRRAMQLRRTADPQAYRDYQREYARNNVGRYLLRSARRTALDRGLGFDLSEEWLEAKLAENICEVSGIEFETEIRSFGVPNPFVPSIDRIDPCGPYTAANCRLVCWIYNRAKWLWTDEDMTKLALGLTEGARQ